MSERKIAPQKPSRATHWKRRAGALVVATGLAAAGHQVVTDFQDRVSGTDVPGAEEVEDHPDKYTPYTAQHGDTLDEIAHRYTTGNHDYRNNTSQLMEQLKATQGHTDLRAGDTLYLPPTTVQNNE